MKRCKGAKVQRCCGSVLEIQQNEEVVQIRCRGAEVQRSRGAEVQVQRCRGADEVQRCRGIGGAE